MTSQLEVRAEGGGTGGDGSGRYASVNGLQMYYEVHGIGRPLVMLHGGMSTIEVDFGKSLPSFAKTRQVIAIEQQAHGHTADIDRPLRYEQMAEDTADLLRQIGIAGADFFGYSVGGGIAMLIAMRYPELVRKVVFAGGTAFNPDGFHPGLIAGMEQIQAEMLVGTPFQQSYARVAPHPDQWPRVVERVKEMNLSWNGWPPEEIQAIQAPVLLISGDSDISRPEAAVELFRLLGGGVAGDVHGLPRSQLAILPGTTHITLVVRVDWLVSMTNAFLEAPMPEEPS